MDPWAGKDRPPKAKSRTIFPEYMSRDSFTSMRQKRKRPLARPRSGAWFQRRVPVRRQMLREAGSRPPSSLLRSGGVPVRPDLSSFTPVNEIGLGLPSCDVGNFELRVETWLPDYIGADGQVFVHRTPESPTKWIGSAALRGCRQKPGHQFRRFESDSIFRLERRNFRGMLRCFRWRFPPWPASGSLAEATRFATTKQVTRVP